MKTAPVNHQMLDRWMVTCIPDYHIMPLTIREVEITEKNGKHRRPRI